MNSGKPGSMAAIQLYTSHCIKRLFLVVAKGPKVILEKSLVARGIVVFWTCHGSKLHSSKTTQLPCVWNLSCASPSPLASTWPSRFSPPGSRRKATWSLSKWSIRQMAPMCSAGSTPCGSAKVALQNVARDTGPWRVRTRSCGRFCKGSRAGYKHEKTHLVNTYWIISFFGDDCQVFKVEIGWTLDFSWLEILKDGVCWCLNQKTSWKWTDSSWFT